MLGVLAARRHGLLELAMESLRRLSDVTMDTSFLSIRRENYCVCLHREEGTYPVRTHALQAGLQHPLGVGAGSLAMLAALPDDDVDRDHGGQRAGSAGALSGLRAGRDPRRSRAGARARLLAQSRAGSSPAPGASAPPSAILTGASPGRSAWPPSTAACSRRGRSSLRPISRRRWRGWSACWPRCSCRSAGRAMRRSLPAGAACRRRASLPAVNRMPDERRDAKYRPARRSAGRRRRR